MRKKRVIIYEDDLVILNVLKMFFETRGYDVVACREPERCLMYDKDNIHCDRLQPCCDIVLTDYKMPKTNGLELLQAQADAGCRLSGSNKAVMSGYFETDVREAIERLGYKTFEKPVTFEELEKWLEEREQHMDLSQPLGYRRKEARRSCCSEVAYRVEQEDHVLNAVLVNRSDSGLCIKVVAPPSVEQIVNLRSGLASERLLVRWTREAGGGGYLVGMSCC